MIFFTLGVLYIAFHLSRGNIDPPLWLILLTLLNPATAYTLFFSLRTARSKEHFAPNTKTSAGKTISIAFLLGLVVTGGLYATIRLRLPKEYISSVDASPSVVFEIREASQYPVTGFTEMINKKTGEKVYVDTISAFSNDDLHSAAVVERSGTEDQLVPMIIVSFTDDAAKEFSNFTARFVPPSHAVPVDSLRSVAILIDGEVLFVAAIHEPVTGGRCFIPFGFGTKQDAERIARAIIGK
jgi:hypothetical protein